MKIKKLKKRWYVLFLSILMMIVGICTYAEYMTHYVDETINNAYTIWYNGNKYPSAIKYRGSSPCYAYSFSDTNVLDEMGTFINNESAIYCLEHDLDSPHSEYTSGSSSSINLGVYYAIYASQWELELGLNNFQAEYYVRQLLVWYFASGDTASGLAPCSVDGRNISNNGLPGNVDENTGSPFVIKTESKRPIVLAYARALRNIRRLINENKDKQTLSWSDSGNGKYDVVSYNKNYQIVRGLKLTTASNVQNTTINLEGWRNGSSTPDSEIKFKLKESDTGYITSVKPGQSFVALIPASYNVNDYYLKGYISDAKGASGDIWVTTSGQQAIVRPTTINLGNVEVTASLKPSTTIIRVEKTDAETGKGLAGALFKVYRLYKYDQKPDDANVEEYASPYSNDTYWAVPVAHNYTDANGLSDFKFQKGVRYRILEVNPPDGYELPTSQTDLNKEVYLDPSGGDITEVKFSDFKIKDTNVYIRKVSSETNDDGEHDRLKGAVFTIEDISEADKDNSQLTKDGSQNTDSSNLLNWTTDSRGVIKAPAIAGHTYKITEITPPSGYALPEKEEDRVKTITIDGNNKWNVIEFQDPRVKGTLTVTKTNRKTGDNLEGVEFSLYDSKGGFVAKDKTNKLGTLIFRNLTLGTYTLKETKTIEGFIISSDLKKGVKVEITAGNAATVEYTATNEKITGKVAIKKVDKETGKPVKGTAIYGLYSDVACTKEIDRLTSVDGALSNESKEVEYGTYYLKEIQAPENYELSSKVTAVSVTQAATNKTYTVTVSDAPKRLLLRLFKKDSKEERYLAGAAFQLYRINDDGSESQISYMDSDWVNQDTFITNSDGYLEIPCWLRYGDYKLVEVEAPEGYNKINDIVIHLDGNTKVNSVGVTSVTVDNDKILGNIKLTKVRGLQNTTVPNTTFALYRITDNNIMYGYKGADSDTDKKIQQSLESLVTEGKQITIKNNTTGGNLDQHPAVPVIDSITVDKDFPQQVGTELNVKANVRGPEGMQIKFVVGDLNGNEYVRQDFSNKTEAKVSFSTTGSKRVIVVVRYNDNGVNKFIRGSIFFQIVAKSDKIDAKDLEKPLQVVQNTPTVYDDQPSPNTEEKNVYNQTNLVKENLNGVEYVNSYTTGEDGSLSVNDLPYGYYFFVEEKVDVPCVQDTTPIIFKINEQGKTLEYTMHNDTVTEFEITKTDVSDGKLLPNTEFAIYADDKTTVVDSDVTDENGIAKFWLTPGTYYYQEIKAPEGYQIDTGLYEFTINDDDTIVRAHMTNSKQGFIITKTDVSDGTLLPNTEFAIYKEDKTTIIETGITDEKGEAKFSLGTGTYYYQEIKAPEGYQIDNELYQFVIKENDEIVRAHMTDSKLPKTGTVFTKDNLPLEITLVVIGVSGLALFLARRKARK